MSFADEFQDMMTDTAIWRSLVSRDEYGVPTFGTGKSYLGRYVSKNRLVRDREGQLVTSTGQFYFGPPEVSGDPDPPPILLEDQIELASGDQPTVVSVNRDPDEFGPSTTVVYFL